MPYRLKGGEEVAEVGSKRVKGGRERCSRGWEEESERRMGGRELTKRKEQSENEKRGK